MQASQDFDIDREYWDFCDDQSRHIDFYNAPTPPLPNQMIIDKENNDEFYIEKIASILISEENHKSTDEITFHSAQDVYDYLPTQIAINECSEKNSFSNNDVDDKTVSKKTT